MRQKVVLDTNVLLSGLSYPKSIPGQIVKAWRSGAIDVVLSDYILDELRRVLPRLHKQHGLQDSEIRDLMDCLSFMAETVVPDPQHEPLLTDPWDQAILGTLRAAQAQHLITGDKALLALQAHYPILTPAQFWARYGE